MAEISPLRRRMIEDMTVRNLSPATQRSAISKFSRHFGRSPDRLYIEDVRAFQVFLVSAGISWASLNQIHIMTSGNRQTTHLTRGLGRRSGGQSSLPGVEPDARSGGASASISAEPAYQPAAFRFDSHVKPLRLPPDCAPSRPTHHSAGTGCATQMENTDLPWLDRAVYRRCTDEPADLRSLDRNPTRPDIVEGRCRHSRQCRLSQERARCATGQGARRVAAVPAGLFTRP